MIDIVGLIRGRSMKNSLDALYYAARFIKQAKLLGKSDKDIFDDDVRSAPSKETRALARELIAAIEANAGEPAAQFSDSLVIKIMNEITSAEEAIEPDFTPAETDAANKAIESMIVPAVRKTRPTKKAPRKAPHS